MDNLYVISQPVTGGLGQMVFKYSKPYQSPPILFANGFSNLQTIAFNSTGDLLGADDGTGKVYKITPGGTTATSHTVIASGISEPFSIAIDPTSKDIFVGCRDGTVQRIDEAGSISVFATGLSSISANATAFDTNGDLYVADQFTSAIWKFTRIVGTTISPTHGGNAGSVTVQIIGRNLQSGATVKLSGVGADIVGTNTTLLNPSVLSTTFDLTSSAPGLRTVLITNPDNTSLSIPDGFTVEQGGQANVSVSIIGLDKIRIGSTQTYYLSIRNEGNVDAPLVEADIPDPSTTTIQAHDNNPQGSSVANQLLAPKPLAQFAGLIRALSMIIKPLTKTGVPGPCQTQVARGWVINGQDPCATMEAYRRSLEAILNGLYAGRLANLLGWFDAILHEKCFDPKNRASQAYCMSFDSTDSSISREIDLSKSARSALCKLELAAGCPTTCAALPDSVLQVGTIASELRNYIRHLQELFGNVPIDQTLVGKTDQDIQLLYSTQALTLPSSDPFPPISSPPITSIPPNTSSSLTICPVSSLDPNEIVGDLGFGNAHWTAGSHLLNYSIYFSNEQTATAPAQSVVVTDQLDPTKLDLNTLALQFITFGENQVNAASTPLAQGAFSSDVDLRPKSNLIVRASANLNPITGLMTVTFTSLDPMTGQPITDPLAGFLPPGGIGSVFFSAQPKAGISTGTMVTDSASVVFDANSPLNTNVWSNLIDNAPPVSQVAALSTSQTTSCFRTLWAGSDLGSGLKSLGIFVADNAGPYEPWLSGTTASGAIFNGQPGHSYAFYSQAMDLVGNVESVKTAPDAITTIASGASCNGRPAVIGSILSKSLTSTTETVTVQLTNSGVGNAPAVNVNQLSFRTLAGTGIVSSISPEAPIHLGSLPAGASTKAQITLNVPSTVKEFSITEQGNLQDVSGNTYAFSIGQIVFP